MSKYKLLVGAGLTVIIVLIYLFYFPPKGINLFGNANRHTIKDVNSKNLDTGEIVVRGYVVNKLVCETCPAGVSCEPCFDYAIISDKNISKTIDDKTDDDLVVYSDQTKDMELYQQYNFTVELTPTFQKGKSENKNSVNLVGFSTLD